MLDEFGQTLAHFEQLRPMLARICASYHQVSADVNHLWLVFDQIFRRCVAPNSANFGRFVQMLADVDQIRAEFDQALSDFDHMLADFDQISADFGQILADASQTSVDLLVNC